MRRGVAITLCLVLAFAFGILFLWQAGVTLPTWSFGNDGEQATTVSPTVSIAPPDPLNPGTGTAVIAVRTVRDNNCSSEGPCDSILNVYENGNWDYFDMGVAGSAQKGKLSESELANITEAVKVTKLGGGGTVDVCDPRTGFRWLEEDGTTWGEFSSCGNDRTPGQDPLVLAMNAVHP